MGTKEITNRNIYPEIPKIALLESSICPGIKEVRYGFINSVAAKRRDPWEFQIFNAYGNPRRIESFVTEILYDNFHFIVPIGTTCAQKAYEGTLRYKKPIPIVFSAVFDPVGEGLIACEQCSGNHLTGISGEMFDIEHLLKRLLSVKPGIKRICFLYQSDNLGLPQLAMGKVREQIQSIPQKMAIQINSIAISKASKMLSKVQPALIDTDAIFITRGALLMAEIDSLITLCRQQGVVLCTFDLESVKRGATMGLGPEDYQTGVQTANKVLYLLTNNLLPCQVPVEKISGPCKFMVNTKALQDVNIPLEPTIAKVSQFKDGLLV